MKRNICKIGLVIIVAIVVIGISFTPSAEIQEDLPEYWALFFAPFSDQSPWKDACQIFKRALERGGWKTNNIKQLVNEDATETGLFEKLAVIAEVDDPHDTTLICIFTHGSDREGEEEMFWDFNEKSISYSILDEKIDELESGCIGIIIDACKSGNALDDLQQEGREIATSSPPGLDAYGSFGRRMAMGFDELGDYLENYGNNNGVVSMREAYDYCKHEGYGDNCRYQDNYAGPLHITFQDWGSGVFDEIGD